MIFYKFSIQKDYITANLTLREFIQLTQSLVDIFIFILVIIVLIYTKLKSLIIITFSYGVLITSEFMLTSCYISDATFLLDNAEIIWLLGLVLQTAGLLVFIYREKQRKMNKWFRNLSSINTKITIWSFIMTITTFILFCFIMSLLDIIHLVFFVLFPIILMLYSLLIILISIIFGMVFELPFLKIRRDIFHTIMKDKIGSSAQFNISEFNFLHTQLTNAIALKNKKERIIKAINKKVVIAAHDMNTQIRGIKLLWEHIEKNEVKDIVKNYIEKLYTISNSLLRDEIVYESIILEDFVKNIINQNKLIYRNCNFILQLKSTPPIYADPIQLERSLLNIITNAYESLNKDMPEIYISIQYNNDIVMLKIEDNGCGIPQNHISSIRKGKSLKLNGHGYGLSSSIEYFDSIGGHLSITSVEDKGTTVIIEIPVEK